jgi:PAS domain S-box-containing protein
MLQSALNAVGLGVRDAVIGMGSDGTIITWNHGAEELFGYQGDEALGTTMNHLFSAGEGREAAPLPSETLLPGRLARFRTKGGAEFEAILTVVPVSPGGGEAMGSAAVNTTAAPPASCLQREALQQFEENIVQLATLNDRIRNPLQVIAAFAEFVDSDARDTILLQVEAINEVVQQLDRGTLKSVAVREYFRKHRRISVP